MLKITNVKMVVDEEGNEVRADDLLRVMHNLQVNDIFLFDTEVYDLLFKAKATDQHIEKVNNNYEVTVSKGERFGEVYAWLREMLEEGAEDEENFSK